MAHAGLIYQPSSMHRTIACPGWGQACEGKIDPGNKYAWEGTIAHDIAATVLRGDTPVDTFLGGKATLYADADGDEIVVYDNLPDFRATSSHNRVYSQVVDQDMLDHIGRYVECCKSVVRASHKLGGELPIIMVEERVQHTTKKELWGTADFGLIKPRSALSILDLKYGMKNVVAGNFVGDNPQLSTYGVLCLGDSPYNVREVILGIYQPRNFGDDLDAFSCSPNDLRDWEHSVLLPAIRRAEEPGAPRVPGPHCEHCLAQATCPEKIQQVFKAAQLEFDANAPALVSRSVPPAPATLDTEKLAGIYKMWNQIKEYFDAVEKELAHRITIGGEAYGFKMVESIGKRQWTDMPTVNHVFSGLGKAAYEEPKEPPLKSPAQMEKVLMANGYTKKEAKELIDANTKRESRGLSLVPSSHKRKAAPPAAELLFGEPDVNTVLGL
jgi:hypothetical protein